MTIQEVIITGGIPVFTLPSGLEARRAESGGVGPQAGGRNNKNVLWSTFYEFICISSIQISNIYLTLKVKFSIN